MLAVGHLETSVILVGFGVLLWNGALVMQQWGDSEIIISLSLGTFCP